MADKTYLKAALKISVFCIVLAFAVTVHAEIIYVDDDATGANDGSSWADAFNYLQDALADANSGDEIWVVQGTYTPDSNSANPNGSGDREATFQLLNTVAIRGGYAGFGEADPNGRDTVAHETILSGDLDDNDVTTTDPANLLDEPSRSENAYNVVSGGGTDWTAVLDGFTLTGGNANGHYHLYFKGSGMRNHGGSPTVLNCKFYQNSAWYSGGGMYNSGNAPYVVNCTFMGNSAASGGGMYNAGESCQPTVVNCVFTGNAADNAGGMYNFYCSPIVTNSTFTFNSARTAGDYRAGGVVNWHRSSTTLTNCIFWGNSTFDGSMDQSAQLNDGTPIVNYCCIQGWTGNLGGTGNFGDDPLFVEALGADNIPGTEDDNPRLLAGSPCLDAGDNLSVPPSLLTDLDGNPRITNVIVDMGAYEGPNQGFLLSARPVTVPESQTTTFTVALATDPCAIVEVTVAWAAGDPDITIQSGGTLFFESRNYSIPQNVILAAAEDPDYFHSEALLWISAEGFVTTGLAAIEADNDHPSVVYVDSNASGTNDGTSWENAFIHLQRALCVAEEYQHIEEIRVAQGLYTPAEPSGDPAASFHLINGVAIYGGYAGFGEPDPNARDIKKYETILTGDLNDDDIELNNPADMWGEQSRRNNSEHVVTGSYVDANAILDGFTITAGYNGNLGAGMYNRDSNPTVTNCTFTWNCAEWGGGMGNWNGSPKVIDCKFESNAAAGGGGIDNVENSTPILINCTFSGNSGFWRGGGMLNGYAGIGGSANPILINCIFSGNSTDRYGGGMYNEYSSPRISNCIFTNNSAERSGGGICSDRDSSPTLTNCTFAGNSASNGNALACNSYDRPSNLQLVNCILWDGGDEIWNNDNSAITITYSDVQGGWPGEGNIDADPCFVEPGYWDVNSTPRPPGPPPPGSPPAPPCYWVDGDYHLLLDSPCIDAGDPNYVAEPNEMDLDGKLRVIGGRIDMGAYEYRPSIPAEVRIVPRTINLASKGKSVTSFLWLPEDYDVADIDSNSVLLEGEIEAESFRVDEQEQVAIVRFDRSEVQGILNIGQVELTITGQLTNGTIFEATDIIMVIDKASPKSAK